MPVSLAASVGSFILLSRRSSRSRDRSLSMPAIEVSRFARRLSAVIAGSGITNARLKQIPNQRTASPLWFNQSLQNKKQSQWRLS